MQIKTLFSFVGPVVECRFAGEGKQFAFVKFETERVGPYFPWICPKDIDSAWHWYHLFVNGRQYRFMHQESLFLCGRLNLCRNPIKFFSAFPLFEAFRGSVINM